MTYLWRSPMAQSLPCSASSSQSVNQELRRWEKAGWIRIGYGGVEVIDREALKDEAGVNRFDEDIGAADVDVACRMTPAGQHLVQQRSVEAPVEVVRPVSWPARRRRNKSEVRFVRLGVQELITED